MRCLNTDFRRADIEPASVDLIATDPPYHKRYLPLWDDLAIFAKRVLKPGGLLVTYCGKHYLQDVMESLGCHLTYRGMIGVIYPRPRRKRCAWNWVEGWKPVLIYGGELPRRLLKDMIQGIGGDRRWHKWGAGLNEALYLVERLSRPGDLVCDPMAGGFTFGQAARLLGRDFIGLDVDPDAVEVGEYRIAHTNE